MGITEILQRTIDGIDVEIVSYDKGNGAFVFISDEYAGSVELDPSLRTWSANPLYSEHGGSSAARWEAIRYVVHIYVTSAMKAALSR